MSQFAEPVIPDEIGNPVKVQYNQIIPGSRLKSAAGGLGWDDKLRHSLLKGRGKLLPPGKPFPDLPNKPELRSH